MSHISQFEYNSLREEMLSVKACITKYVGLVLGGAAGAIALLLGQKTFSNGDPAPDSTIILVLIAFIFVVSSFYFIILYKINSHNRIGGFLHLITQETNYDFIEEGLRATKPDKPVISWEFCLGNYRVDYVRNMNRSGNQKNFDVSRYGGKHAKSLKFDGIRIEKLFLKFYELRFKDPLINHNFSAVRQVFFAFFASILPFRFHAKSWKYPLYVTFSFIIVNVIFVLIGINEVTIAEATNMLPTIFLAGIVLLSCWIKSMRRLYAVMWGKRTLDAYCWIFFPYRVKILNNNNIKPTYLGTDYIGEIELSKKKAKEILNFYGVTSDKIDGLFAEKNKVALNIICEECLGLKAIQNGQKETNLTSSV